MNKFLGKAAAKVAKMSAKSACNSASLIGFYQPVAPKQLKKAGKLSRSEG